MGLLSEEAGKEFITFDQCFVLGYNEAWHLVS